MIECLDAVEVGLYSRFDVVVPLRIAAASSGMVFSVTSKAGVWLLVGTPCESSRIPTAAATERVCFMGRQYSERGKSGMFCAIRARSSGSPKETSDVTDQEKQKAEEMISRLELLGRTDVSRATAATPR